MNSVNEKSAPPAESAQPAETVRPVLTRDMIDSAARFAIESDLLPPDTWEAAGLYDFAHAISGGVGVGVVDDLAATIRKLVRALRKAAPDNGFAESAMDYLRRHGLEGSPLRAAAQPAQQSEPLAWMLPQPKYPKPQFVWGPRDPSDIWGAGYVPLYASPQAARAALEQALSRLKHHDPSYVDHEVAISETVKIISDALAAQAAPADEHISDMTDDDLALFMKTADDFEDCGETETPDSALFRWARMGLLECTNYVLTDIGRDAINDAAIAASKQGGNHGE